MYIYGLTLPTNYLMHYGVDGMKWGVRKREKKTYKHFQKTLKYKKKYNSSLDGEVYEKYKQSYNKYAKSLGKLVKNEPKIKEAKKTYKKAFKKRKVDLGFYKESAGIANKQIREAVESAIQECGDRKIDSNLESFRNASAQLLSKYISSSSEEKFYDTPLAERLRYERSMRDRQKEYLVY